MFDRLTSQATQFLQKTFSLKQVQISWQFPREADRGDLATTVALSLAKELKQSPKDIAATFVEKLRTFDGVARAEVAGAGFVNVWLTPQALLSALEESREAQTGKKAKKNAKPVIVEYSQPNIAKPLGVHHILSTVLGQAISNIYEHLGHKVIRWNYLGDWGTQFGKLAVAVERWGEGKSAAALGLDGLLDLYVRFHNEEKEDASLGDAGREAFRKLEQGDKAMRAFWESVVVVTKQSLTPLYERLHVRFDLDLGESFYEEKMEPILEEGKRKKVFVEGEEGALIVRFPEESNLPPYMVQKKDGATLYATRDIAQMRYRIDTYHPSAIFILTDVAQRLHFQQLEATCKQLQWDLPVFENVWFGRMRFADRKMSTRKGNILKLEEVLDEAVRRADAVIASHGDTIQTDNRQELAEMMGIGAVVYGIVSQNRKMDLVFDWDRMLSFEGNSAPYLQYTHARARSVLRKAELHPEKTALPTEVSAFSPSERLLLRTLLLFPGVLTEAMETHMPHKLATFLYQLSQDFNAFYNIEPILKAEEPARTLRLALTAFTALVLHAGAELLTLRVPDRM